MQRVLTTGTLLGLLAATAAAFAITEHLKLIKSPVYGTKVTVGTVPRPGQPVVFSPVCDCPTNKATVTIRLRRAAPVTLTIVDSADREVATVRSDARTVARRPLDFVWHGRTDAGAVAPDGVYHPWVNLRRRTLRFLNNITVDTKAPKVHSATGEKQILFAAPGRTVAIAYSFSEKAHVLVYLGRRLITVGRRTRQRDRIKWAGTLGGRRLPAGTYVLSIGARDLAGNDTPADARKQVTVQLRYIQVTPERITVRAGRAFTVHVETTASRYTWHLGHRHGARRGRSLRLRAPTTAGTYRLVVTEQGHTTTAAVRVRAK
ncbi:MAG TPA: FlgD immunoglobulin-like domain containing protein [Gaiellaceae bacterium]